MESRGHSYGSENAASDLNAYREGKNIAELEELLARTAEQADAHLSDLTAVTALMSEKCVALEEHAAELATTKAERDVYRRRLEETSQRLRIIELTAIDIYNIEQNEYAKNVNAEEALVFIRNKIELFEQTAQKMRKFRRDADALRQLVQSESAKNKKLVNANT